jgi:hypothetical protein
MDLETTSLKEWIRLRANAVRDAYSTFDCLNEFGHGANLPDPGTSVQTQCAFHGVDNNPSARYYPRQRMRHDYFRCYKCRESWDSINLYGRFKGLRFMDALAALEKRFRVRIPRRPEGPEIVEPAERDHKYVSDKWADVPRVLAILEAKLARVRPKCGMHDYVKFCRVMDAVAWDFARVQSGTSEMAAVLKKLMDRMDEASELPDFDEAEQAS